MRSGLLNVCAVLLVILAFVSSAGIYIIIFHMSDFAGIDTSTMLGAVLAGLTIFLALISIVSHRIVKLWLQKKRGVLGLKLQSRIVVMFVVVSIVPTLIVSVFSTSFFNYGIKSWFNQRLALEQSLQVADSYLQDHNQKIRNDIIAIVNYLSSQPVSVRGNISFLQEIVRSQANLRELAEVVIFQNDEVVASNIEDILDVDLVRPWLQVDRLKHGDIISLSGSEDRVRSLTKVEGLPETYLMAGRLIDYQVSRYVDATQNSARSYRNLQSQMFSLQAQFLIVFLFISLLLLLASVWVGIHFSSAIVLPVTRLFYATERVQSGDFTARVEEGKTGGEITTLAKSFNKMIAQLEKQHKELTQVYRNINERRIFIEAVLSGISSGVIAITQHKYITLFNSSAKDLLLLQSGSIDNLLNDIVPEISALVDGGQSRAEIVILRGKKSLTLSIKIDILGQKTNGYIITFDDISKLVAAQRAAAWSDVARRIAHEIKNPITPIYLAAERLNKKYQDEIKSDKVMFTRYINTIIKHVTSISRIADEFANFARMPSPSFAKCDICKIIRESAFSGQFSDRSVHYQISMPDDPLFIVADESQVTHVFINLLKNACESISMKADVEELVMIKVIDDTGYVTVSIEDNGVGFPYELIDRLTEPYVTTRNKGTGLGLAIVKKIVDEHNAKIAFCNTDKGALVQISFIKYKEVGLLGSD